jgi:hypothetical protein
LTVVWIEDYWLKQIILIHFLKLNASDLVSLPVCFHEFSSTGSIVSIRYVP